MPRLFTDAVLSARASGEKSVLIHALLRLDRWDEALGEAEDAVRAAPQDMDLQGLLALAQLRAGHPEAALTTARAARKLAPENYFALLAEAMVLVRWLNDDQAALPLARKLVALRPDQPEGWWVLVQALDDPKETLTAVARLQALKPQGYPFAELLEAFKRPGEVLEIATRLRKLRKLPTVTEFPDTVRLPISRQEEMVFVTVRVNNKNLKLLFDTGASEMLALNANVIRSINPSYVGRTTIKGAKGSETARVFVADKVSVGAVKLGRLPVAELQRDPKKMPYRYDGLFGGGLLNRYAVTLDFGRSELLLRRVNKGKPLASLPPVRGASGPIKTYTLPLHLNDGYLYLPLELQAPRDEGNTSSLSCPLWALLDTGASLNLISKRLTTALSDGLPREKIDSQTHEFTGTGISQTKAEFTIIKRPLRLAFPSGLLHPVEYGVGLSSLDTIISPNDGFEQGAILGMPFLSSYRRVTVDYPNKRLILETDSPRKAPAVVTGVYSQTALMSPSVCPPPFPKETAAGPEKNRWIFAGFTWAQMPEGMALPGVRKVPPFSVAAGYIALFRPATKDDSASWWLLPETSRALPDNTWEIR